MYSLFITIYYHLATLTYSFTPPKPTWRGFWHHIINNNPKRGSDFEA